MSYSPYLNHTSTFENDLAGSRQNFDHANAQNGGQGKMRYHRFMDEKGAGPLTEKEKDISYLIMPLNIISAGLCIAAFGLGIAWFGWPDRMSLLVADIKKTEVTKSAVSPQKTPSVDKGYYTATLNGQPFLISGEQLRHIHRDEAGNARRIDILAHIASPSQNPKGAQMTRSAEADKIFITVSHKAATTTPETRLQTTYKHHLADEGVATSLGLTLYRFKDETGYGDQELYTGTLPDGPYVSVCFDEQAGLNASRCLASVEIGKSLVARYSFDRTHIKNWSGINQTVRQAVRSIKVGE